MSEKIVSVSEGAVMMNWTVQEAKSILCQAMFDETLRLRKTCSKKERDSIRRFLTESYQTINASDLGKSNQEKN